MKTLWKNIIGACALVGVTSLVTTQVVSQDQGLGDMDHDKMMQEWMKLGQPGPEHAKMAKQAGKWNQTQTHWEYPGSEPSVSTGMATLEPILGGRFMIQKSRSKMEFMGEAFDFEGFGLHGYDNGKKKHFFVWVDNMGTLAMIGEGEETAPDEITYMSELADPMSGGVMTFKCVSKTPNDNENTFEMFMKMPDGTWHRNMLLDSKRKQY